MLTLRATPIGCGFFCILQPESLSLTQPLDSEN